MAELPTIRSSVALIERVGPDPCFFLEHRRTIGDFPYSGKVGFFGGGAEPGEDPWATVFREVLDEELSIYVPKGKSSEWRLMGKQDVLGQGRDGAQVLRTVALYNLLLPKGSRVQLSPRERQRSDLIKIAPSVEDILSREDQLTPFARSHLLARVRGEGPWEKKRGIWR